jgi:HSP20 family protein
MFGLVPYNRKSIFDDFFSDSLMPGFFTAANPMKADIRETEKEYVIDAEIPGAKKEDIKLELRDDTLTIAVEHSEQVNDEKDNYIRKERRYSSYSRSFYLENVRNEDVAAKYNDGILTVTLPKSKETRENKHRIEIQ